MDNLPVRTDWLADLQRRASHLRLSKMRYGEFLYIRHFFESGIEDLISPSDLVMMEGMIREIENRDSVREKVLLVFEEQFYAYYPDRQREWKQFLSQYVNRFEVRSLL